MSGTSLDGVDVVLCKIDESSCELLYSLNYPFPSELKVELLSMMAGTCTLEEVGRAEHSLAILFTEAVASLLLSHNIDVSTIKAIGSHGQTLWHDPEGEYAFTMQLGDPNIIAAKTGIRVVADFRRKDIALGGQGAPFAPAFHEFIFSNINSSVSVINIGGMANITVLEKTANGKLIGYDTGCGNVLLDAWISKHKNLSFDGSGEWAKTGSVDYILLDAMMSEAYFSLPFPKSTGREKFNERWLDDMLKGTHKEIPLQDVQRTLLELTALSISNEVLKFNTDVALLCGGGAHNDFLVERIKVLMPNIEVGIAQNTDYIEAMTFAWLAYKRIHEEKVNLKDVTGAKENTILGGVYA